MKIMRRISKLGIFLLLFTMVNPVVSQSTDIARMEYTYFPQADSDNSFRRFKSFVNLPIKLNDEDAYLIPGLEYENVNLKFADPTTFDRNELERFQSMTVSLGYTFKMNEDWRFGAEAGTQLASNFEVGDIISDDLIYTGSIFFIKIKEDERYVEPWRLILGLQYSTTSGVPFPLPIINYYKRFEEKWSYGLGVPKTNLRYYIDEKHILQGFVTLDGFFANIQNNFKIDTGKASSPVAENISMTIVLTGLGYSYNFTDHFSFYFYAGHTLWNDIRLRDHDLDDAYTINETNTFYSRAGLKFSIL